MFTLMRAHEARHEAENGVGDAYEGAVVEDCDSVCKPAFQWTCLEKEYAA